MRHFEPQLRSNLPIAILIFFVVSLTHSAETNETTYDAMFALWEIKSWEVSGPYASKNDLVRAEQTINPGLMQRVCYYSNRLGIRPFASLSKSESSKTLIGMAGLSYAFDDDIIIGVEMESGKFNVKTVLTDETKTESEFDGKASYDSIKLKCGTEVVGGFLSYKQMKAPNVDTIRNDQDSSVADIYYDEGFKSKTGCIGVYVNYMGDNGLTLRMDIGVGTCIGTPGNDVKDLAGNQWNIDVKPYDQIGVDLSLDLNYHQDIGSYGKLFVGARATMFGHMGAIGAASGTDDEGANTSQPADQQLRSSRYDLYFGPYVGVGLVF